MKINCIKMEQTPEIIEHKGSLIDYVHDNFSDRTHIIFKAPANKCSFDNQVNINDIDEFMSTEGEYTIVETPGDPFTAVLLVISVIAVAVAAYVYFNLPTINTEQGSGSNNRLRARTNQERPLQRIEDIAGKVRSYPTLIQQVYKKFNNTTALESEYSLMCISKGEGEISNVKDSETPISAIPDAGAMFYGPGKLASSDTPFLTVGTAFNEPIKTIIRSNEVSGGQVLDWGSSVILGVGSVQASNDAVVGTDTGFIDLALLNIGANFTRFTAGEIINLTFIQSGTGGDISGVYEIVSIPTSKRIELDAVGGGGVLSVSPDWADGSSNTGYAIFNPIDSEDRITLGPFFLSIEDRTEFFANFVADGLQTDKGNKITVEFVVEYAQADEDGNQIGSYTTIPGELTSDSRDRIGATVEVVTPFTGPCLVKFRRTTGEISDAVLQDIKLDALYSVSPIVVSDFGDVTTVQTRTIANANTSQAKERKFNCFFTRKLNVINPDGTIGAFKPTERFIDYYFYSAIEQRIGRRDIKEVNTKELHDKYLELIEYFDSDEAGLFNYTFDSDQISFQQTLQIICESAFCRPVRRGGILTARIDMPGIPRTIFTHRNKIPDQQTITRKFKSSKINDGVEYQYIDPKTNNVVTLNIPDDGVAIRPEKVQSKGVRNHNQAWWLAWRRYNQLTNQKINIRDILTSDGSLLSPGDIVAISNNTKMKPQSGDVLGSNGLLLTLSEPVIFKPNETYSIALRKRDGSIDVIPCGQGITNFEVVLERAPVEAVYTGYDEERTVFIFNKDDRLSAESFIITEIDRTNTFEIPIEGFNYTDAYYERDGEQSPKN